MEARDLLLWIGGHWIKYDIVSHAFDAGPDGLYGHDEMLESSWVDCDVDLDDFIRR